jgi:DNA-directed RNA polymerase I, II, and III subunit RPABC3
MELSLDINCELFPLKLHDKVSLLVAKSLSLDEASGAATGAAGYKMQSTGPSLADKFDYVMHGKVYKLENLPSSKMYLPRAVHLCSWL